MKVEKKANPVAALVAVVCLGLASRCGAADGGEKESEPVMPNERLVDQGRWLYERNCVVCHGENGDGRGEMAATLAPKPRPFSSGVFKFHTTPAGKLPTNEDLKRTIQGGLTGTAMGMFTQLREADIEAVAEYLKTFSRKWRKAENYAPALKVPPLPEWFGTEGELKKRAESGRVLFAGTCAVCHGANGDGKGAAVPTLKDVWGEPAAPADLRDGWLRRGTDLREVWLALVTGRDGTPMVSFAQTLTDAQRWDLVAYVAMLRKTKPAAPK